MLVAEIGCNHKGDFEIAKLMISVAATCGAHVAKFQKRSVKEIANFHLPHPNPQCSYGATYGEHREKLEFSIEQHAELMNVCNNVGIQYSTSVWDLTSAKEVASLNPSYIKIPSACNNHTKMIRWLVENYHGDLHISIGMSTSQEIENMMDLVVGKSVVLYACTSGYPVDFKDICLLEIPRLKSRYGHLLKDIGFSGHHLGIAIDNAALALGANWIERHFTLNRNWKGSDHAASLEPDDLKRLSRDLQSTMTALTYKSQDILDVENPQRQKLKWLS